MKRELLLLRHGKSDWSANVDDFHRPLKDRGKRGAQRMGVWLWQQDLRPDYLLASPAERALVSAEKAGKAMGRGDLAVHRDERIYGAEVDDLLGALADCPETARRVLLVGHNPGLEELLLFLCRDSVPVPDDGKLLPTATLARLEIEAGWNSLVAGCARLLSITRPAELPKKFPFPAPDGAERRDRPAYYYTQSSVIPWRRHHGELQVLIISSSQNKHAVVPKGIKDPGLSPRASAAKEAWEEAGVEGEVAENSLGSYSYEKWGASCTVEVYAMQVTRVVPEEEWEERHRGREWVSPETAAKRVKQEALKPMLAALAEAPGVR